MDIETLLKYSPNGQVVVVKLEDLKTWAETIIASVLEKEAERRKKEAEEEDENTLLTVGEVARIMECTKQAVYGWQRKECTGVPKPVFKGLHPKYRLSDIKQYLKMLETKKAKKVYG